MAKAGPRKIAKYGEKFKATAVKLSSLPGVQIKAGLSNAIISANEPPTGFIVTHSRGVNFVYKKSAEGQ